MPQYLCSFSRTSFAESAPRFSFILPLKRLTANRQIMLGRLTSLSVIFVLLFGTVILPSFAHAQAPAHGEESFEAHEHDASTNPEKPSDNSDQPCHAVTHHHCGFAVGVEAGHIKELPVYQANKTRLVSSAAMPSWSQAPPTQPPSA